jgi:ATP-dependent Lon protease
VKEKVLAAHRAGIRELILPAGNERDLRDVPADVREHIEFHFVDRMDDVVRLALLGQKRIRRKGSPSKMSVSEEPRAAKKK